MTPEEQLIAMHFRTLGGDLPLPAPTDEEKHKQEVVRAAEVLKVLNTVGGSVIKDFISTLASEAVIEPEKYLVNVEGELKIDQIHVSSLVGVRKACKDILDFFAACGRLVDEEANRVANEGALSNK